MSLAFVLEKTSPNDLLEMYKYSFSNKNFTTFRTLFYPGTVDGNDRSVHVKKRLHIFNQWFLKCYIPKINGYIFKISWLIIFIPVLYFHKPLVFRLAFSHGHTYLLVILYGWRNIQTMDRWLFYIKIILEDWKLNVPKQKNGSKFSQKKMLLFWMLEICLKYWLLDIFQRLCKYNPSNNYFCECPWPRGLAVLVESVCSPNRLRYRNMNGTMLSQIVRGMFLAHQVYQK